jgi:hypothetical protein
MNGEQEARQAETHRGHNIHPHGHEPEWCSRNSSVKPAICGSGQLRARAAALQNPGSLCADPGKER